LRFATRVAARGRGLALLVALGLSLSARLALAQGEDPAGRPYPHGEWQGDCTLCHDETKWTPARPTKEFDHGKHFALRGAHGAAACRACHTSLDFTKARADCVGCHQDVHRGELGQDCVRCHTPRSFIDRAAMARLHHATRFPLTGAHAASDCDQCHLERAQGQLRYVGLPSECESCHDNPAFKTATQRPESHDQAGYPQDCGQCHNTVSFDSSSINHAATGFPLTGAHASLECARCHGDPFQPTLPRDCYSCHAEDYQGTTDPSHVALGFPHDCAACHTTTTWEGARFDHSGTSFPLTGAHASLDCAACHADGVYQGKPTACYSCHRADYEGTRDPNHDAAGFSTDCALCHTTTSFDGARYVQHDGPYFPIYSGTHNGRWSSCADCHTNSSNYSVFSCFRCHSQSETDPRHDEVSDYRYDSAACYSCHPRGIAED
jgi:hypothetical protein